MSMRSEATVVFVCAVLGCGHAKGEHDTAGALCAGSELTRDSADLTSLDQVDSQLADNFRVFESFTGGVEVSLSCGEDDCEALLDLSFPTQCEIVDYEMGPDCDKDLVLLCRTEVLLQGCAGFQVSDEYELVVNGGDTSHDPEAFEIKGDSFWMLANPNGEARIKRAEDGDVSCEAGLWSPGG